MQKTLPALDFMRLLIQHIPEKNFKMIRYYGLYARRRDKDKSLYKAIPKSKHQILRSFTKWRSNILLSFGYDPLNCPKCRQVKNSLNLSTDSSRFYHYKSLLFKY